MPDVAEHDGGSQSGENSRSAHFFGSQERSVSGDGSERNFDQMIVGSSGQEQHDSCDDGAAEDSAPCRPNHFDRDFAWCQSVTERNFERNAERDRGGSVVK